MASKATGDSPPPRPVLQPKRAPKTRQTTSYAKCTSLVPGAQQRVEAKEQLIVNQKRLRNGELFDEFMENTLSMPLTEAFEPQVREMFQAERCVLWIDQPEKHCLSNSSFSLVASYSKSVPGICFRSREIIHVRDASQAPGGFLSDQRIASPNSPQLFIPLVSFGTVRAVAQIVKRVGAPAFNDFEMQTAAMIMKKFGIYGDAFFSAKSLADIALSLYASDPDKVNPLELVKKHFRSDIAELWLFDVVRGTGRVYNQDLRQMVPVSCDNYGIVGFAVSARAVVNSPEVCEDPHYSEEIDGCLKGPALALSTQMGERTAWAIVLRRKAKQFSTFNEVQLKAMLPFVMKSVAGFTDECEESNFNSQLSELLDAATVITSKSGVSELVSVVEDMGRKILMAEVCVLLKVDTKKREFVRKDKRMPMTEGAAGKSLSSHGVVNFEKPVKDSALNALLEYDEEFVPTSLLAAPVYAPNGDIIAVLMGLNKVRGQSFDTNDERIITAFNIFAGIAIVNAGMYKTTVNLIEKLRKFVETTLHTNEAADLKPLLSRILSSARKLMKCKRIACYTVDNTTGGLQIFVSVGDSSNSDTSCAKEAHQTRKMVVRDLEQEDGKDKQNHPYDLSSSCVSGIFTEQNNGRGESKAPEVVTIVCKPLLNAESTVLGVVEVQLFEDMSSDEKMIFDSCATLLSMSLERVHLKELAPFGYGQLDVNDWIGEDEKGLTKIPTKLAMDTRNPILDSNFSLLDYDGIGHVKVLFALFDGLGLLESLQISSQSLFRFLSELRATYNHIPYHNWRHAVDVCQFVSYLIHTSEWKDKFTKSEILSILVAALAHDAGHEGFDKKGPAMTALYQSQSVLESQHCSVLITVLSKDDCNLFKGLPEGELKKAWNDMIQMILATDMARHFDIVGEFEKISGSFNIDDPEHRLMLMKLLIKCSDLSLAAKSGATLKSCESIADEFFEQGDRKQAPNMKPRGRDLKCLHAFMTDICLPLYEVVAKVVPALEPTAAAVRSNVENWES